MFKIRKTEKAKKLTAVAVSFAVALVSVPVMAQENGVQTPDSPNGSSEVQVQDSSSNAATEVNNASNGDTFTVGNIEYTISDETAKTCCVSGNDLKDEATVKIPDKVTDPDSGTEYSVTSIGDMAFYGCSKLESITIPISVTNIKQKVFFECTALKTIDVDSKNTVYQSIDGVLYTKDLATQTIVAYPEGKSNSYTIDSNTKIIGETAFYGCSSLKDVKIPSNVTDINQQAFSYCSSLENTTIPSTVSKIDADAFARCSKLKSVTFEPNSNLMSIGIGAFALCTSLESIEIPSNVTIIYSKAFYGCAGLISVKIPSSVTKIKQQTFDECTSLKAIDVDSNNAVYQSIDGVLYTKDPNTKTIVTYPIGKSGGSYTIDSGTKTIGNYAFSYCSSLESITISSSVEDISSHAFYNCTNLKSIAIPSSVKTIDNAAFYSCYSLENINISSGVEDIGAYAFDYCNSLKSITIPSSVTDIGYYAFLSCESLTTVTFEEGSQLNFIGGCAFSYCPSLENIIIPSGVSIIGQGAFKNCTSLKNVLLPSTNTGIVLEPDIFDNTPISTEGGGNFYTNQSIKDNYAGTLGIPDSNFKIIDLCPQEPAKPSNLKVTPKISASSNATAEVIVSWDAVTPPAETVGYHKLVYQLQRSTDGGTTWENVKSLVTDTTVQDTVSGDLTQTQYRVAALNQSMGSEAGGAFENVVVATTQGQYSSDTGGQIPTPTPDDGGNNAGGGANTTGTSYSSGSAKTGDNAMAGVVGLTALVGLGAVVMLKRRRK